MSLDDERFCLTVAGAGIVQALHILRSLISDWPLPEDDITGSPHTGNDATSMAACISAASRRTCRRGRQAEFLGGQAADAFAFMVRRAARAVGSLRRCPPFRSPAASRWRSPRSPAPPVRPLFSMTARKAAPSVMATTWPRCATCMPEHRRSDRRRSPRRRDAARR